MAKFNTKFDDSEVNKAKLKCKSNPLSGTVEEVQAQFDALPLLVKVKLEDLISELNTKLSNVENTADADKPLSTEGLNKLEELRTEIEGLIESSVSELEGEHEEDVSRLENSIAQKIADLVGQAPETLNTLQEIAEAFTENQNIVSGILETIGQKASQTQVVTIEAAVRLLNTNKVDKLEGKGLSTKDFTDAYEEKLKNLENYDDAKIKDEFNLKLYGTTDVYTLTSVNLGNDNTQNADIWTDGTKFVAQTKEVIKHDVVIIPEGIEAIEPMKPAYNDETEKYELPVGVYPIKIEARKIICPSTLVSLTASTHETDAEGADHNIEFKGEVILNGGLETISLDDDIFAAAVDIGDLSLPSTIKNFSAVYYARNITIPADIEKFTLSLSNFEGNLYVYNANMDFSKATFHGTENYGGTIYGYIGSTAEKFAKENGIRFVNIGIDYSAELNKKADKVEIKNLENYGTTDVYVLQEGVDYTAADGIVTEMLKWDYTGQTIAFPEGLISTGRLVAPYATNGSGSSIISTEYFKCKKLILPKTMKICKISSIWIDEIDTGNVKEIYLNSNIDERDITAGKMPYNLEFGKNIEKIELLYGVTKISFKETPLSNVRIYAYANRDNTEYDIRIDLRNVNSYSLELVDEAADEVDPSFFTIYGYSGSDAEYYAKRNYIEFVNIGSDCTPFSNKSTSTETTIRSNEYYIFTQIESLTVTLDTASTTKLDEFMFSFETPADMSDFSFGVLTDESVEIKWIKEPNLKPNYIYEVSVVNGVGVIAGTAKEVA